jgi:hypothetical protein
LLPGGIGSPLRRRLLIIGSTPVCLQLLADLFAVVAAVGPQLRGPDSAREQLFQERQQVPSFVLVAGADPDRERCPAGLDC